MRAVFLDRDGVINENRPDHVRSLDQFRLLPGALEAVTVLDAQPFAVLVVTNQAAVGRGQMTAATLHEIHGHLAAQVRAAGGRIDGFYACIHHPNDWCACRKPLPGLLQQAAADFELDLRQSYFVGDAATDVQAARAVGCQPILVLTGRGQAALAELRAQGIEGFQAVADLASAVQWIVRDARHATPAGIGAQSAFPWVRGTAKPSGRGNLPHWSWAP